MSTYKTKSKNRVTIYTSDIQNILGCCGETARRLMRKVRKHFNKGPYTIITIAEFCECTGVDEALVREYLV